MLARITRILLAAPAAVALACAADPGNGGASADMDGSPGGDAAEELQDDPRTAGGASSPDGQGAFAFAGPVTPSGSAAQEGDTLRVELDPDAPWFESEADRRIIRETVSWAREQGLDGLPPGEILGMVGSTFVGTPYEARTLETPSPERLVVNLRNMDCVTFVEQMLALVHLVRLAPDEELEDEEALAERFRETLSRIRYRNGEIDGYPSRLHYFSEWIADNSRRGLVEDVSRSIGGTVDERPIHFMSSNPEAYPRLREVPEKVARIREMEEGLNRSARYYLPQDEIERRSEEIRTGDIIAATSSVDGLDVAHTGIALWHEGRLHLLHAPLVDGHVEISELPLAQRILERDDQDGIMVARPADPGDRER